MQDFPLKTFYEPLLSDQVYVTNTLSLEQVQNIFHFFQNNPLFIWTDANNDCEDRANAISILLDEWQIPNYKGWVFSGAFLKNVPGALNNLWNYHVAVVLPVRVNESIEFYTIDPATLSQPELIANWANNVTDFADSYYLIKHSNLYIFNDFIDQNNWYFRDFENYRWTIEGLAGINGVSPDSENIINNNIELINNTENAFNALKNGRSPF